MNTSALDIPPSFSALGKVWNYRERNDREALRISQILGEPDLIAHLLSSRGITSSQTASFLTPTLRELMPDPSHLLDMDKGVACLIQAIKNKDPIAIFGDYDVDGATSAALLYRFLEAVHKPPLIYIPDRTKEGYGPNLPALLSLKEKGIKVIITVDCGTTAFTALEEATKAGLEIIVLDHHRAQTRLPDIAAVINPNRVDQDSPCKNLAAVGVCFLFSVAVNRELRKQGFYKGIPEPHLLNLLDLVALGTVCDVVPLTDLNRAFVFQGLKVMAARRNLGLKTLCDQAGLESIPSPYHLGFVLGPRINAGGRVGESLLGSQLLTTQDAFQAQTLSQKLNHYNEERRMIEAQVLEEAILQAEKESSPFLCVMNEGWHPGVIGIIASRLKDKFHRPVAVISLHEGVGKASARSIHGFDLGMHIQKAYQQGLLLEGGGHPMAGGFSLSLEKVERFKNFMNKSLTQVDMTSYLLLDGNLSLSAVTSDFIKSLERIGPYGAGNPTPKFSIADARVAYIDQVGENHLRCTLQNLEGYSVSAIAFKVLGTPLGEALLNSKGKNIHVAGSLSLNVWGGQEKPQLIIDDMMG